MKKREVDHSLLDKAKINKKDEFYTQLIDIEKEEEKLSIIKQYLDSGYYLTAEVKGATKGSQHWVAVTKVDGNSVIMVDPGSNQTIMWNAYNYEKTTQFNYFKVEG